MQSRASRPTKGSRWSGVCRLRLDVGDVLADIGRRLRVRVAECLLHPGHEVLRPAREVVVDRAQELERRRPADVRDRGARTADELPAREVEGVECLERRGECGLGVLRGLRLELVIRLRGRG